MKVMTIIGTRPEMIKMSEIIKKFDNSVSHILVHTGQNYDHNLGEIFYEDLGLRKPDYYLNANGKTTAETIAKILIETEKVIQSENPDAVVIHGDTNTALASIIVKRYKIPLIHLEAGNRSYDDNVPEEINRRLVDHISDINMVYSENSRSHLLAEGLAHNRIYLMGSPMKEVLKAQEKKIKASKILKELGLKKYQYYLVSIHRDENLEVGKNLNGVLNSLNLLASATNTDIIMTLHPKTKKKLKQLDVKLDGHVRMYDPFNFSDYCKLQQNAVCVISDSGTISEESALLGFPAITIRNAIERPEAIDAGVLMMTGTNPVDVMRAISLAKPPQCIPDVYTIDNCSQRVLNVVLSFTPFVNRYVWMK